MSKPIKDTVNERVARDPEFRKELLKEALEAINCGDIELAKSLLDTHINTKEN